MSKVGTCRNAGPLKGGHKKSTFLFCSADNILFLCILFGFLCIHLFASVYSIRISFISVSVIRFWHQPTFIYTVSILFGFGAFLFDTMSSCASGLVLVSCCPF